MSLRKVIAPVVAFAALSAGHPQFSPEKAPSAPAVFEVSDLQDALMFEGDRGQAQCDPEIDICQDPSPDQTRALNACGSLAVLRAGLEDVSDSENPLVSASEKASISPPNNSELTDSVRAFSRLFAKEHPEAHAGKTPQALLDLVDLESVKRTTTEVIDARQNGTAGVALLLGLIEQAKGAVNEATSDLCIDRQGRPKRDNEPGILAASLTCKVIEATDETLKERIAVIDRYRLGEYYQTTSTLPTEIPYDESPSTTTTPPRDRINPRDVAVEPAFADLATLLNVGFVQEFPGMVEADAKEAAGIQTLLKKLQHVGKDSVDYRELMRAHEAANSAHGAYCAPDELFSDTTPMPPNEPTVSSTLPPKESTTTTTMFTIPMVPPPATPIAPPAVPIQKRTSITG